MRVRCGNCGAIFSQLPAGVLRSDQDLVYTLNENYHCPRCGHSAFRLYVPAPQNGAVVGLGVGAALGGLAFGPIGALVGGLLGTIAGSNSGRSTD